MTPLSSPTPTSEVGSLRTPAELAEERFGDRAVLDTANVSVLDLARKYAEDCGLTDFGADAETTTMAVVLASCRASQLRLLFEIQVDLEKIMEATGCDYGGAVFSVAKGGGHARVWAEIDTLESRATSYLQGLEYRADVLERKSRK